MFRTCIKNKKREISRFDKRVKLLQISSTKYDKLWNRYWEPNSHQQNKRYIKFKK